MPEMIAKVQHWYGGRERTVGERFHVEPAHVRIQMALGRVEVPQESGGDYQTTHFDASPKKKRNRASLVGPVRKVA